MSGSELGERIRDPPPPRDDVDDDDDPTSSLFSSSLDLEHVIIFDSSAPTHHLRPQSMGRDEVDSPRLTPPTRLFFPLLLDLPLRTPNVTDAAGSKKNPHQSIRLLWFCFWHCRNPFSPDLQRLENFPFDPLSLTS